MISFAVEHTVEIFLIDGGAPKHPGVRGSFPPLDGPVCEAL